MTVFNALCHHTRGKKNQKTNQHFCCNTEFTRVLCWNTTDVCQYLSIFSTVRGEADGSSSCFWARLGKHSGHVATSLQGQVTRMNNHSDPRCLLRLWREHTNPTLKIPPKGSAPSCCVLTTVYPNIWETNIYLWHTLSNNTTVLDLGEKSKLGIDLWPSHRCHYIPCKIRVPKC